MSVHIIGIICNIAVIGIPLRNVERRTIIDRFQTVAILERIIADTRYAIWNCDAREATAIIKRIITDARHSFGNRDAREATAIIKRNTSDARHASIGRDHAILAS